MFGQGLERMPGYVCSMCQRMIESESGDELVEMVKDHFRQEHEQRIREDSIRDDLE